MNFATPILGMALAGMFVGAFNMVAPVTIGMTAEIVEADAGELTLSIHGRKIKDCGFVKGSAVGWYRVDGVWHETAFAFLDDPTPDSTRPSGWEEQGFGLWHWAGLPEGYDAVRMTNANDCQFGLEITKNGPFQVK